MTKQDIINAAKELKELLKPKEYGNPERIEEIKKVLGEMPAIKQMFSDDYDRRAMHPGHGAPDCYCHLYPPCQNCVDFTNAMTEEELDAHIKKLSHS